MSFNTDNLNLNGALRGPRSTSAALAPASAQKSVQVASNAPKDAAKGDGFSFWDLVDIVNPLQHIPVVGTIYREITGDKINGFARIAGGALFGGVIGAAMGGVNAAAVAGTGKDVGQIAMAKVGIGGHKDKMTKDDNGIPFPSAPSNNSEKLPPVIEVRPVAKADPAKEALVQAQLAKTEPSAGKIADADAHLPPALQAQLRRYTSQSTMPHKESEIPSALPTARDFNELTPGKAMQETAQTAEAAEPEPIQISQQMSDALDKYISMQPAAATNEIKPKNQFSALLD